ncbi:MAG: hypothetical protein ACI9YR_001484, partial [Bacteroidia bacterium]
GLQADKALFFKIIDQTNAVYSSAVEPTSFWPGPASKLRWCR